MDNDRKTAPLPHFLPSPLSATEVTAYFTKSNFFRVIHVDGVFGGPAPTRGNIVMTVFSARSAIPDLTVSDGYGREIVEKRAGKNGVEQECEASLMMSVETAKQLAHWLLTAAESAEAMMRNSEGT